MYSRIVVPLDGRPEGAQALAAAEALADRWDASLELVSLVDSESKTDDRLEAIEKQAEQLHRSHGTMVQQRHWFVAPDLLETQAIDDSVLVVMATTAHSRSESFLGSVTAEFLKLLRRPVLLVGPNVEITETWLDGPMIVCTDGSAFSETIIDPAIAWSAELDLHPWVISVSSPSRAPSDDGTTLESGHVARLASTISKERGVAADFEVLHGKRPGEVIVDHANRYGASIVALATHGHTGLKRLALGSVAMSVVHDAKCPVLVCQPDG